MSCNQKSEIKGFSYQHFSHPASKKGSHRHLSAMELRDTHNFKVPCKLIEVDIRSELIMRRDGVSLKVRSYSEVSP